MKKHKRNRRHQEAKIPAPKEVLSATRTGRGWLRRTCWLAGLGLVLLLGFLAFNKQRHPMASIPATITNGPSHRVDQARLGLAGAQPVRSTNEAKAGVGRDGRHNPNPNLNLNLNLDSAAAQPMPGTNNAGIALNQNAEKTPVPDEDFVPHTRPGTVVNREKEGQAADLNNEAGRLLRAGDTQRAIQFFEQAKALLPTNETIHFNLGIAFTLADDTTNAEQEYKEALRLLPDYPEAHEKYGELLVGLGRLAEAVEHLTRAVEQMPDSAQSQNSLGVARQRRNETNEALLCFQRAVQCDSNCWEAHYNLALAYLNRKNREKEIAELRQTLRINPDFQPAQHALALILAQEPTNQPPTVAAPK